MRGKSIALLMLALGCGLIAAIGITKVLAKRNAEPTDIGSNMQPVVVAARDITFRNTLSADDVKIEPWPKDKVPAGALSKLEDAEGRIPRVKLFVGEPILDQKLLRRGVGVRGPSTSIPKGYRVVPVKVDSVSGGAGLIIPGDRVDVLVSLMRNPGREIFETETVTILQDIRVFAVNDDLEVYRDEDDPKGKSMVLKTISLLVTLKQATSLFMACELGRIRLVMRGHDDDSRAKETSTKPGELFGPSMSANRDKEKLVGSELNPEAKNGFLSLLGNLKSAAPPPTGPLADASPVETWNMRILQPDGVNDVVMEASGSQAASGSKGIWRMNNATLTGLGGGSSADHPSSAPPPTGPPAGSDHPESSNPTPAESAAEEGTESQEEPAKPLEAERD